MSDIKNIDDLFRSKLSDREVAYESEAWVGAEQMLNRHFRRNFLRKILFIGTPIIVITTLITGYLTLSDLDQMQLDDNSALVNATEISPSVATSKTQVEITSTSGATAKASNSGSQLESTTNSLNASAVNIVSAEAGITQTSKKSNRSTFKYSKSKADTDFIEGSGEAMLAQNFKNLSPLSLDVKSAQNNLLNIMPAFSCPKLNYNHVDHEICSDPMNQAIINQLKRFELNAGGGIVIARAFLNDQESRAKWPAFGCYLDVNANYHINRIFYIESGLGIQSRGKLANDDVFVSSAVAHTLHSISANYLNIPISFNYRVSTRHTIGGGIQFNPLLTVIASDETQSNSLEASNSKLVLDKTGFINMDFALFAKYRYDLTSKWMINAQAQYGMTDATENNGKNKIDDRNILVKAGLSYRLF